MAKSLAAPDVPAVRLHRTVERLGVSLLLALASMVPRAVRAAPESSLDLGKRQGYGVAVVGSQLLIAGGMEFVSGQPSRLVDTDEVDILDGASGEWSTAHLSVPRSGVSVAVVGTEVVFAGGYDRDPQTGAGRSSAVVDVYDSTTGSWAMGTLSEPRENMTVAVVGSQVLLAGGGHYAPSGFSSAVDVYDAASGAWSQASLTRAESTYVALLAPPITRRPAPGLADLTAWTVGTQVLFVESMPQPAGWMVDVYDSATGGWTNHALAIDQMAHVVVSAQHAILVGTWGGVPTAVVYDAGGGTWVTAPISSSHSGGAAASVAERVVLAGGTPGPDPACTSTDSVDIYNVITARWSRARLSEGRAGGMAVSEVGGRLVLAGGLTCSGVSDHVDIYTAATDTWSSATLSQARTEIAAIGAGALVLLAGGLRPHADWAYGEATEAVDIYDADTDRWTTGHLAEPRIGLSPAALGSKVLLAGGNGRQRAIASHMLPQPWLTSLTPLPARGQPIACRLAAPARWWRTSARASPSSEVTWTAPAAASRRPR